MNHNDLPSDDLLQFLFGELEDARRAAVRKAIAEDTELAATAEGLAAAVAAVRAKNVGLVSDTFNDRLRRRMSEILDSAPAETTRPTFLTRSLTTWRWMMRSPVSRVTAAAILVLAVTGVALWFHGSGTTPAFADFIEPILHAKTVKYKVTGKVTALSPEMKLLPVETQQAFLKGLVTSECMMMVTPDGWRARNEDTARRADVTQNGGDYRVAGRPWKDAHPATSREAGHDPKPDQKARGQAIQAGHSLQPRSLGLLSFAAARRPG